MRIILAVFLCVLLVEISQCQIPNVYEFCSALMNDQRPAVQCGQCHSREGKRGPEGRRGLPGPKGEKGNEGTSDTLNEKLSIVEGRCGTLQQEMRGLKVYLMSALLETPGYLDNLVNSCGLGMKNRKILDSAITVSSQHIIYPRYHGRLDNTDCWAPASVDKDQWFQVDLNTPTRIIGVVTQGQPDYDQWVTSYKVLCGNTTSTLTSQVENGSEKTFPANSDRSTKVMNIFPTPVVCRYVRINPQTWQGGYIKMRMELIGGECDIINP